MIHSLVVLLSNRMIQSPFMYLSSNRASISSGVFIAWNVSLLRCVVIEYLGSILRRESFTSYVTISLYGFIPRYCYWILTEYGPDGPQRIKLSLARVMAT